MALWPSDFPETVPVNRSNKGTGLEIPFFGPLAPDGLLPRLQVSCHLAPALRPSLSLSSTAAGQPRAADPWEVNFLHCLDCLSTQLTFPFSLLSPPPSLGIIDASPMSHNSMYHAVIGGVVAIIVFFVLILLIVLGHYLIRHKGKGAGEVYRILPPPRSP